MHTYLIFQIDIGEKYAAKFDFLYIFDVLVHVGQSFILSSHTHTGCHSPAHRNPTTKHHDRDARSPYNLEAHTTNKIHAETIRYMFCEFDWAL